MLKEILFNGYMISAVVGSFPASEKYTGLCVNILDFKSSSLGSSPRLK